MTGVPSREETTRAFNAIDKDGNGKISPRELHDYMVQLCGADDGQMMSWFADIDKDGDEKITLDELLNEVLKAPRAKAIEEAFQKIDSDGSGTLKKEEVLEEGPKCGLTDVKTIAKCFAKMDADNSNSVDKNEFINYMNGNY